MTISLLPPNATLLERALEAGAARIVDVIAPTDIDDPLSCPADVLPWLAWEKSVDSWDPDWPEATKRDAVARSIALHMRKGTRDSVEATIARFDEFARVVEWHEQSPRAVPHTFEVHLPLVAADGAPPAGARITAAFAERLLVEISRVKPLREHQTLVQLLAVRGGVGVQGAARLATYSRQDMAAQLEFGPEWDGYLQAETGEPLQSETASFLDTVA